MLKARYGKLAGNLVILIALVLCLTALTRNGNSSVVRAIRAQNKSKKTITAAAWPNCPIKFLKAKVGDKEVKLDEEFENGDEWFKGLTVKFKNVSNKDIKYFDLYIGFPETRQFGPIIMSHLIRYGRYPGIWEHGDDITLKPGDEAEINISDFWHGNIKAHIEKEQFKVKDLTNLDLLIQEIMFSDDTMYYGGSILHRESPGSNHFVHPDK